MAISKAQLRAMIKRLEGPVQRAFMVAVQNARTRAKLTSLIAAIQAGDLDAVFASVGVQEAMWSSLTESIRNVYISNGTLVLANALPKRRAIEFNINNPRAETWLRANSSRLITGHLMPETRSAIQVMLQDGMVKGKNPRSVALDIVGRIGPTGRRAGGVIGLTEQQASYVVNMADDLALLDERYFTRTLRDKRFDSIVRQSIDSGKALPQATRDKIVSRYEDRMLKHRGDTIGRTETLRAINEATDEALEQVVEQNVAPKKAVKRVWRHSYSPNERPGHVMMDGQKRALGEFFTNPLTGAPLLRPGAGPASETINCRCYLEPKIDFIAVEAAA